MTTSLDRPLLGSSDLGTPADPPVRSRRRRRRERAGLPLGAGSGATLGVAVLWLSLLVLLPLAAVVGTAFDDGWSGFADTVTGKNSLAALELTIGLSVAVALVNAVMGTLVAWVLVRERFRGSALLELVIDIPFALPTIVAGLAMLAIYGEDSPVGISLVGSRIGLFVALLFVTLPFTVRTVQPVLLDLDRDAEQAAASLGASGRTVFRRIVLPQLAPAVLSGAALSFARALGEYGSLVLISSNLVGKTEIAASRIYAYYQGDDPTRGNQQASALSVVLLAASVLVLILLELVQRRRARRG